TAVRLHTHPRRRWLLRRQQARRAQFWQGPRAVRARLRDQRSSPATDRLFARSRRPCGNAPSQDVRLRARQAAAQSRARHGLRRWAIPLEPKLQSESICDAPTANANAHSAAQAWTVARKTHVFNENRGLETPQVAGLGNLDP